MEIDTGLIAHLCICGSAVFKILATFEDYEIATYSTEMYCSECGTKYVTPLPINKPKE